MTATAISSGHAIEAIQRRHPLARGWVLATEVSSGSVTRRADAVAIGCWRTQSHAVGYEVKVTRHDMLREFDSPEKRGWIETICRFTWLATAPGVVDVAELPDGWGLFHVTVGKSGARLRRVRQAADRGARDLPTWLTRCLGNLASELDVERRRRDVAETRASAAYLSKRRAELDERGRELAKELNDARAARKAAVELMVSIYRSAGISVPWGVDPRQRPGGPLSVETLRERLQARSGHHLAGELQRQVSLLDRVRDDLARILEGARANAPTTGEA